MDQIAILLFSGIFASAGCAIVIARFFPADETLKQSMVGMIFAFSAAFFKHLPGTSDVVISPLAPATEKKPVALTPGHGSTSPGSQ